MFMGLGLALGTAMGATVFNPATQFAPAFPGLWYDPSDYSTLSQDSTGMTPVTGVAQPVGLMLDKRLGLVTYPNTGWTKIAGDGVVTVVGNLITITGATTSTAIDAPNGYFVGSLVSLRLTYRNTGSATGGLVYVAGAAFNLVDGASTLITIRNGGVTRVQIASGNATFLIESITERLGNHLSQATATSRPLTNTQSAIQYLTFDGIDDGMATGAITLSADMDCFIAVRRNGAAAVVLASADASGNNFFAVAASANTSAADLNSGTPTYAVNGVALNGGAVGTTRGQLHTAMPVSSWVVVEVRNLNLTVNGWLSFTIGNYAGFQLNGDIGGIILAPAGDATARQKNRQYLGAKVGLVLP